MTNHITTNGNQIHGTTGNAQLSAVVADRDACVVLRSRCERSHSARFHVEQNCCEQNNDSKRSRVSRKPLRQTTVLPKRLIPFLASRYRSQEQQSLVSAAPQTSDLPAAAWATFVINRSMSYGVTSL